jgi:hypothetical protein
MYKYRKMFILSIFKDDIKYDGLAEKVEAAEKLHKRSLGSVFVHRERYLMYWCMDAWMHGCIYVLKYACVRMYARPHVYVTKMRIELLLTNVAIGTCDGDMRASHIVARA